MASCALLTNSRRAAGRASASAITSSVRALANGLRVRRPRAPKKACAWRAPYPVRLTAASLARSPRRHQARQGIPCITQYLAVVQDDLSLTELAYQVDVMGSDD